jgi:hypothetical protein
MIMAVTNACPGADFSDAGRVNRDISLLDDCTNLALTDNNCAHDLIRERNPDGLAHFVLVLRRRTGFRL